MKVVIVIPARYHSRRYPGKPLARIRGRSMIERTWSIAKAVAGVDEVYIATEDQRIVDHARTFGAKAIMTSAACRNGTERVREAVRTLAAAPGAVVNLQGDAVLTPPWVIQALIDALGADPSIRLVTPAVRLSWPQVEEIRAMKEKSPTSGTLVTFDRFGRALYFSKSMIPYVRIPEEAPPPVYRHIGIYGYRIDALDALVELEPTPLERAEELEQLRALENGIPIQVVVVDYGGRTHWSIDAPEDVAKAEAIIEREGELLAVPSA